MGWLLDEGTEREVRLEVEFGPVAMASLASIDLTDGVRMTFTNGRIIHLRGSGNAPELRCYAEAESADIAKRLAQETLALVAVQF
jgi:phosphomannomutase